MREEWQSSSKERDELRAQQRAMRDKLPRGVSADGIDAKLRELEFQLAHEPGQDEKNLYKRISELTAARPLFREAAEVDARLKAIEDSRSQIQARLQQCDAVLTNVKAQEEAERKVLADKKAAEPELDFNAMNAEKQEVRGEGLRSLLVLPLACLPHAPAP